MVRYKLLGDQKDIDYGTVHEQDYKLKINMVIVDQYGDNYEDCCIYYTLHNNNIKLSELIKDIDNCIRMRYLLNIHHLFQKYIIKKTMKCLFLYGYLCMQKNLLIYTLMEN